MSKGFYKNRRLKSFIFLSACFLVAFIPHAYHIESFFYLILILSFVIVFYGLIVISSNFKRNNVLNTVSSRIRNKDLPVLDILVAARDEENVIARLVERLFNFIETISQFFLVLHLDSNDSIFVHKRNLI